MESLWSIVVSRCAEPCGKSARLAWTRRSARSCVSCVRRCLKRNSCSVVEKGLVAGRNDTVIAQSPGMVKRIKKIASQTSACSSVAHSEERSRIKNKKKKLAGSLRSVMLLQLSLSLPRASRTAGFLYKAWSFHSVARPLRWYD